MSLTGWVLKNYVQALQKRDAGGCGGALMGGGGSMCELGAGECSTLQSDATHLTILPDAHLAALSESDDDSLPPPPHHHIDVHHHHHHRR